jgi:dihydrolipoamide dehydrogenase
VASEFDVVVVGAGTGGYVAAIRAAQLGLTVAVVERQTTLGGTCLIWGCIPTKALLEHAHALKVAQAAKEWGLTGVDGGKVGIDMPAVHARKDKMITGLTGGIESLFKKHKITWLKGSARITSPASVEVTLHAGGTESVTARKQLVIATGSAPRSIPGIAVDGTRIIFSDHAIHLGHVPKSIAIMGSGAVGVEFASIFKSYGSDVTIIELMPKLVPLEDEAVSNELERTFKKRGIKTFTGTKVTSAKATATGVDITMDRSEKSESLNVEVLLVATGRGPVTDGLGVETIGLTMDRGYVVVDALFQTNVPGVSAIGDVITMGGPHYQLAHVSSMEGILLAEKIAGHDVAAINYDHVPRCTYTEPEIGSVGLTEAQAKAAGHDVRIGSFPFRALARARMAGEVDGFVKIVAEKKYDEVLGVHIIGPRATELIAEAVLALRLECTVEELVKTIHAHPTMSEAMGEAAHAAHGAAIHI